MLSQFLTTQLFAFLLTFCRLGSAIMLLPGFGEIYVTARTRLLLALMFSLILSTVIAMPPMPGEVPALFKMIISEILIGLFLGGLTRMLISAIHVAGSIIAYQSSLSSALTLDMTGFAGQDSTVGNLLSLTAVVLMFVTDLHHVMLRGLADSYTLFLPGQFPLIDDFSTHAVATMSGAFSTAMKLAAPSLVIGMLIYLGAGILARLMPNIQIFFIMIAPQLLISFFVLTVTISAMLMWYLEYFKDAVGAFLSP